MKTGVCLNAEKTLQQLREGRQAIREAGFGLLGSGLHPADESGKAHLVSKPRYEVVRKDFGDLLRTPPCGLHVHVGIPDAETAVRVANAFRLYLPVLQALGRVEVRAIDVQTDAAGSSAFAALIQAIAAKELERPTAPGLYREALEESYFQAASHGLDAEIFFDADTPAPAREVGRRVLDAVRPFARELSGEASLEEIERILQDGNGAEDQRRIHRGAGMDGLLDYLAARTR